MAGTGNRAQECGNDDDIFEFDSPIDQEDFIPIYERDTESESGCMSCCTSMCITPINGFIALSFSVQNTALNLNTLYEAAKEWGAIEQGHEFRSVFTYLILASGLPLGISNTRSYFRLMQDFVGKSGAPSIADRWHNMDAMQRFDFINGAYVSFLKTAIGGISLYNFSEGLTQSSQTGLTLTALTLPGNFFANASVFLRPKAVLPYLAVGKELQLAHLERKGVMGVDQRIQRLLKQRETLYTEGQLGPKAKAAAIATAGGYGGLNANLYLDNSFTFGKTHGIVDANASTLSSWFFWINVLFVATPCFKGNIDGYYPLMKDLFKYSNTGGQGRHCSDRMLNMLGDDRYKRFWNLMGLTAASVKTVSSSISLTKTGFEVFEAQSSGAKAVIATLAGIGGLLVGAANAGVYLQPKVSYIPSQLGPQDSYIDDLEEYNDLMPLNHGI